MQYITNITETKAFQDMLIRNKGSTYQLDVETTGLDPFTAEWLLLQVGFDQFNEQFVFDVRKLGSKHITYICELLAGAEEQTAVGHNLKFDLKIIYYNTKVWIENLWDTQLAEILIYNGIERNRYPSLDDLCIMYLGISLDKTVRETFYKDFNGNITQEQLLYAAEDVRYLSKIAEKQKAVLQEQGQMKVAILEMQTVPCTAEIELNGILLDIDKWRKIVDDLTAELVVLDDSLRKQFVDLVFSERSFANCFEAVECMHILNQTELKRKSIKNSLESITDVEYIRSFIASKLNLNSPTQLKAILRDVLQLKDWRGNLIDSTNEKIIDKLSGKYPIILELLKYREKRKAVTSFGENYISAINPITGRLHTNYNQIGAQSGRYSNSSPNLFNIPKEEKYRNCFIAPKGKLILSADYSQEELRLMADQSKDPNMCKAFIEGADLHTRTAALINGTTDDFVTKDMRKEGKGLNFTVGYDGTPSAIYKNYGIPFERGAELISDFYNKAYTGLRDHKAALSEWIWEHGYARTPLGRKRFFDKPTTYADSGEFLRFKARTLRELGNHAMGQGPGADVLKMSLVRLHRENPFGDKFKVIHHVYDEIVTEIDEDIAEQAQEFLTRIMVECLQVFLKIVPAKVDPTLKPYWSKE